MNERLNQIIAEKNISKYRLARESGIPYSTLNDICNGKTSLEKCSVQTVMKIAAVLHTSIEVLIDNPMFSPENSIFSADNRLFSSENPMKSTNSAYTSLDVHLVSESLVLSEPATQIVSVKEVPAPNGRRPIAHNWADARKKKYHFPVLPDFAGGEFAAASIGFDICRIHPLKQRRIISIYNALHTDPRVESATIFGSAVTIKCGRGSDIDICIGLKSDFTNNETKNDVSEAVQEACHFDADILWRDRIKAGSLIDRNINMGLAILNRDSE